MIPSLAAAEDTIDALCARIDGIGPPITVGQKCCNCRSAAEWKVRACALGTPRPASRCRISKAARLVKVTASTESGGYAPIAVP